MLEKTAPDLRADAEVGWIDSQAANKIVNYGIHLTMRLADIERREALEGSNVAGFLTDLVGRIGMRILAGPLTAEENGDPMHRGWSGVIILYESHAAIHTYPELGQAFLDIFSCKPYDVAQVREILAEKFGSFTVIEQSVVDRGVHWSSNAAAEMKQWQATRA